MTDKYLQDGCKMMWHPERIADFLAGKRIAPLHIDVGLSKGCNIHCLYCFGVMQENLYTKGINSYFPRKPLLQYIKDASEMGVKSMAFIGEAEPTLSETSREARAKTLMPFFANDSALAKNSCLVLLFNFIFLSDSMKYKEFFKIVSKAPTV